MAQYRRPISIARAHETISQEAVDIANGMVASDEFNERLSPAIFQFDRPFRIPEDHSLGLQFWDGVAQILPEEDIQVLNEIGKKALQQAIVKQGKLFVGLILGEAREGRNYFDYQR